MLENYQRNTVIVAGCAEVGFRLNPVIKSVHLTKQVGETDKQNNLLAD